MAESGLRLFFALQPDATTQAAMSGLAREIATTSGGRAVAAVNLHLTLVFLGEQPSTLLPQIQSAADSIRANAFSLAFDRVDSWRKNGIVWAGASLLPPALATLRRDLVAGLERREIALDNRPFAPHLTLARNIASPPARTTLAQVIEWPIDAFSLIASTLGQRGPTYRVIARWPLAPGAASGDSA